jgi:hypothetical protein
VHWADGGVTAVHNMALLCDHHHRVIHYDGWTVRISENGLPEFTPPRWIDPAQVPIARPWRSLLAEITPRPPPREHETTPPQPRPPLRR